MVGSKAPVIQMQQPLRQVTWEEINEPGAYVEVATGTLYRVPREALRKGAAPRMKKEGAPGSQFVQLSRNPFIFPLGLRMVCLKRNIRPNF